MMKIGFLVMSTLSWILRSFVNRAIAKTQLICLRTLWQSRSKTPCNGGLIIQGSKLFTHLWNMEESEQLGQLDGHCTRLSADQSDDVVELPSSIHRLFSIGTHEVALLEVPSPGYEALDEVEALFQGVHGVITAV